LVPAGRLGRRPPRPPTAGGVAHATADDGPGLSVAQALRTPQFIAIALTHFACCAAHSGPIFHMVSYAMVCGVAPMIAATVYSAAGLASLGGRIFCGLLADRVGAKPVLVGALMVQAVAVSLYLFTTELSGLYGLSMLFGMAYGGVMPLYAVLVREYFGERIMGTVFGGVAMISSLGMAFGPWAGGWVFDHLATYSWLYIGSFAFGLGAVAIALTFRPLPLRALVPARAAG
ncbi:MAG: MFS transporter, partial [Rubrivivax sp.]|nr:MFS transporter [Rubrivivax sp.]